MKFHDAIRKHIKVLDNIQRLRTKDEEWGLFRSGGPIGERNDPDKIIKKFDNKEEAENTAKRRNGMLSSGEKQYYKIKYFAKKI